VIAKISKCKVLSWKYLCSLAGKTSTVLNVEIVDNGNVENLRFNFIREHFLKHNKFGLLISRGSVVTYLRYGGQCYMRFVTNSYLSRSERILKTRLSFGQVTAS